MQAVGWCTNVAWNVGFISARSYRLNTERYKWIKVQQYQSAVAMVYLTWNLARNLSVPDVDLYQAMKLTMLSSIRTSVLLTRLSRNFGRPVRSTTHKAGAIFSPRILHHGHQEL